MRHLLLSVEDSEADLRRELLRVVPGVTPVAVKPLLLEAEFDLSPGAGLPHMPHVRQFFPRVLPQNAESIRLWSENIARVIEEQLPEGQPWTLHIEPHYGAREVHHVGARAWHTLSRFKPDARAKRAGPQIDSAAGVHRCELVRAALVEQLRRKRRHSLKALRKEAGPFLREESLVQVVLTSPAEGYVSVSPAPEPFNLRHLISFLPMGRVEVTPDKTAPSRAFAKLVEAEIRLGHSIEPGQTCVDLGAAPGSWTYVAANRGARVLAIDRSPLRGDLMSHPSVRFIRENAFEYEPSEPADWLLCDVIAEPAFTAGLLLKWLRRRWCRTFIVTLKLKDSPESFAAMEKFAAEASALVEDLRLTRLCANKKEACAFGITSNTPAT